MSLADQASLLFIPSGYKSQKVYSIFPTDGDGDFDFSRSGSATRIAKNGLITTVDSNVPRLEYPLIDGVVNGCPSLLLEPQSTNLCDVSKVDAYNSSGTISRNTLVSPSPTGVVDSVRLIKGSVGQEYFNLKATSTTLNANTDYTQSIFVKRDNADFTFRLEHNISTNYGTPWNVSFTITNSGVTVNSEANAIGKVKDYGSGWYRVSATVTTTTPTSPMTSCLFRLDGTNGIGASILLQYNQFEQQSYATSYIPTNGSTVTRNAETCNNAGDASTFNDSEGVLMAEISALADYATRKAITISDGISNNERVLLSYEGPYVRAFVYTNSLLQCNFQALISDVSLINKIALKYKQNDFALWINGIEVDTDTIGVTANGLDRLSFSDGNGANPFYGNTKQIQYYNSALTDSELEKLTSWTSFIDMANGQQYSII